MKGGQDGSRNLIRATVLGMDPTWPVATTPARWLNAQVRHLEADRVRNPISNIEQRAHINGVNDSLFAHTGRS